MRQPAASSPTGTLIYTVIVDGNYFTTVTNSTSLTTGVVNDDPVLLIVVREGSKVAVAARDLTFFSQSPLSNVVTATLG